MITFILLFIFCLIPFFKEKKTSLLFVLLVLQSIIIILFLFEYSYGSIEYLISDGKRYFEESSDYIQDNDRKAWGLFNYFVKTYDYLPEVFIKFMNIPILFIFIFYLKKHFSVINYKLLLAYPYLFFLSISNLRDILIWLSALFVVRFYFIKKSPIYFILSSILLIFLRPLMIVPILTFILGRLLYNNFIKKGSSLSKKNKFKGLIFFVIIVGASFLFKENIESRFNKVSYSLKYRFIENLGERLDERASGTIEANNLGEAFFMGALRYVTTPLPTSKIKMLLSDKSEVKYGYFTEYLRVTGQIVYFFMMLYIAINFRKLIPVIKKFSTGQAAYAFWLFSFFPIYAFYHFGTGHQRLKLPFQIFIFIIFIYVYRHKKNKQVYG